jgi:hypothetical protein
MDQIQGMNCLQLRFSRHALERMFERAIPPADVARIVAEGEWIADYPDDKPYPSTLLLGYVTDGPVHAVVAHDPTLDDCVVSPSIGLTLLSGARISNRGDRHEMRNL